VRDGHGRVATQPVLLRLRAVGLQSVQVRIGSAVFRSSGDYFPKEDLGRPIVVVLDVVHHFCARWVLEGCLERLWGRKSTH
jgi:hypothetical protein